MKRVLVLLMVGLIASVSLIATSPAGAKKGHAKLHALAKKWRYVRGTVAAVGTGSVTVKLRNGATVTFAVTSETKIRVNGQPGTLADVQVGFRAAAKLAAHGGRAKVLVAAKPLAPGTRAAGLVASVGTDSITLTKRNGSSVTIPVTGDTKVRVNGHAGQLAEIEMGYRAVVRRTSPDGPAAVVRAYAPGRGLLVRGVVQSVGSDSITLRLRRGASATIAVTASTQVFVSGHAAALSDIQNGFRAIVLRAAPGGAALAIVARPAS
jgi:hypothetical protein